MEMGEVGMTRDATIIKGETGEFGQGVTEKLTETETQELKEIEETQEIEQIEVN